MIYGKLYNWYAVAGIDGSGTPRNLAPAGYHVPSIAEWDYLTNNLGGVNYNTGSQLRESSWCYWRFPSTLPTNSSGFTALPAGEVEARDGGFTGLGNTTRIWSSTSYSANQAYHMDLYFTNLLQRAFNPKEDFKSVRLVKD